MSSDFMSLQRSFSLNLSISLEMLQLDKQLERMNAKFALQIASNGGRASILYLAHLGGVEAPRFFLTRRDN